VRLDPRSEISVDKSGRVTGTTYLDAQKREVFQKAKAVVRSANGLEAPRLLLLSKSTQFPDGLANSNGAVGKYLMSGNVVDASGLFDCTASLSITGEHLAYRTNYLDLDPPIRFAWRAGFAHENRLERQRAQHVGFSCRGGRSRWVIRWERVRSWQLQCRVTMMSTPTVHPLAGRHHYGREPREFGCECVATALAAAGSFRARCLHVSTESFG
jgi:choline dehydrogenase-like flavoprotein